MGIKSFASSLGTATVVVRLIRRRFPLPLPLLNLLYLTFVCVTLYVFFCKQKEPFQFPIHIPSPTLIVCTEQKITTIDSHLFDATEDFDRKQSRNDITKTTSNYIRTNKRTNERKRKKNIAKRGNTAPAKNEAHEKKKQLAFNSFRSAAILKTRIIMATDK